MTPNSLPSTLDHERGPRQKLSFLQTQAKPILDNFIHHLQDRYPDYNTLSRDQLRYELQDFINQEYGGNLLSSFKNGLITGESMDFTMDQFLDQSFSLDNALDPIKGMTIAQTINNTNSEQTIMTKGLETLYHQRNKQPDAVRAQLPLEDFLHSRGYLLQKDATGNLINISAGSHVQPDNINTLKEAFSSFVIAHTNDQAIRDLYTQMLQFDQADLTEKVVAVTTVRSLMEKIEQLFAQDPARLGSMQNLAQTIFGPEAINDPVPATIDWISFPVLQRKLQDFLSQLQSICSPEEFNKITQFSVSLDDCISTGIKAKLFPAGVIDESVKSEKYSQLKAGLQHLMNSMVQSNIINTFDELIETIDTNIEDYAQQLKVPSSLYSLLEQLGLPNQLTQGTSSAHYLDLIHQQKKLKNRLTRPSLSKQEKEDIQSQIRALQQQINTEKRNTTPLSWQEYINYSATRINQAQKQLGHPHGLGETVGDVLTKLHTTQRDITALSHDEQQILLNGILSLQLAQLKESDSFHTLGYTFDEYRQFIESLYDLNTMQSTIMTKDGMPITLNFTKKGFVGGVNLATMNLNDLTNLEAIRLEFEIDLNNNPEAEHFLRVLSQGTGNSIMHQFFKRPNFPQTITESSKVIMTDHNGITYEGYLSPTHIIQDQTHTNTAERAQEDNSIVAANTFILYTHPADQIHADRNYVTAKDSNNQPLKNEQGKLNPIYINTANADQWASIEVIDKKATLSGKQLGALQFGHMMMKNINSTELDSKATEQYIKSQYERLDHNLVKGLQTPHHDLEPQHHLEHNEEHEQLSESEHFLNEWKNLVGDKPLTVGSRLAVAMPDAINNIPTIKAHPSTAQQLLSMTVKDLQYDANGAIRGATFAFDTLSRMGRPKMSDITLVGEQLSKIKEIFKQVTYLDNIYQDEQDYANTLARLQTQFSKDYNWANIGGLEFDGEKFKKEGKEITHFLSTQKTNSKDDPKGSYDVYYTVQSLGNGRYTISSSAYCTEIAKDDGSRTTDNIVFETTTDLTGLLLTLANRGLIPYTEEEYQNHTRTNPHDTSTIPQKERKTYDIRTWMTVLKGKFNDVVGAIKKKIGPDEEEDLRFTLFHETQFLNKLSTGWIGQTLDLFGVNVLEDMVDEAAAEGMNFGRNKINGVYEYLMKFHQGYNVNTTTGMSKATGIIDNAVNKYPKLTMDDRWKTAGAMLYIFKKMKHGYGKLPHYPTGTYVKLLFGPDYYEAFKTRYQQLEVEAKAPGSAGKDAQDRLATFEFNYIIANTRGGDILEKEMGVMVGKENKADVFYFQTLYGRGFPEKLAESMNIMKAYSFAPGSNEVKNLTDMSNFDHVYNDCKDQMIELRMGDCLASLIALQKMAKTPDQADKVSQLFMAGILSGAFIHNLSLADRKQLANLMRNSAIPYAKLVTDFDGARKMKALLSLATGGKFDERTYGSNKTTYHQSNFNPITGQGNKKEFVNDFIGWFNANHGQVTSFLHMDASSMKTNDNLIRVRKSQDPQLQILGKTVPPDTKMFVNEIMNDFYFEFGRGVNIDHINDDSGIKHVASMDMNYFSGINKYRDGSWDTNVADIAKLTWENLLTDAPHGKEKPEDKDRLMFHVNNFFRFFNGIGSISYARTPIEQFYTSMRLAQSMPANSYDRARLIWFNLTQKLYERAGPVPAEVEEVFKKYMTYFEANLEHFDQALGELHTHPNGNGNFSEVFTSSLATTHYIPHAQWRSKSLKDKNHYVREQKNRGIDIINRSFDMANERLKSGNNGFGGMSDRAIGKSVDEKIITFRGGKVREQTSQLTRAHNIATNNASDIDLGSITQTTTIPTAPKQSNNVQDQIQDYLDEIGLTG